VVDAILEGDVIDKIEIVLASGKSRT